MGRSGRAGERKGKGWVRPDKESEEQGRLEAERHEAKGSRLEEDEGMDMQIGTSTVTGDGEP